MLAWHGAGGLVYLRALTPSAPFWNAFASDEESGVVPPVAPGEPGGECRQSVVRPASAGKGSDPTTSYLTRATRIGADSAAWTYYHADALGSVRALSDASGQPISAHGYSPYGDPTTAAPDDFGYTGEQTGAGGLVYLRARYYDPGVGVFLSADPSRLEANLYAYVGGNPVNRVDPSGLCSSATNEGFYTILGCRENGRYTLRFDMSHFPWSDYAVDTRPRRFDGRYIRHLQDYPIVYVPVRHPRNLVRDAGCNASTQDEAIRYYLDQGFSTWEVNARNLMIEMTSALADYENSDFAIRDAIAIAYTPYNRVEYNRLNPGSAVRWNGYYGDERVSAEQASLDPTRVLLNGNQFGVANEQPPSSPDGEPTRPWLAALNGLAQQEGGNVPLDEMYELSLIVSFGVHYRLFRDTGYGATVYVHRTQDNPARVDGTIKYVCVSNSPAFLGRTGDSSSFYRKLTTDELAAVGGWPSDLNSRYTWQTPNPPEGCQEP